MIDDIKYCKMCGTEISNLYNDDDWYKHISIKYCPACRELSDKQKTALRVANFRKRKKQKDKFRDEQLELLSEQNKLIKAENELLRQQIISMRENKFK